MSLHNKTSYKCKRELFWAHLACECFWKWEVNMAPTNNSSQNFSFHEKWIIIFKSISNQTMWCGVRGICLHSWLRASINLRSCSKWGGDRIRWQETHVVEKLSKAGLVILYWHTSNFDQNSQKLFCIVTVSKFRNIFALNHLRCFIAGYCVLTQEGKVRPSNDQIMIKLFRDTHNAPLTY